MKRLFMIAFALLTLVGCSEDLAQSQIDQLQQVHAQSRLVNIDYLTDHTWLNLTQEEVKHRLGDDFSEILSAKENKPMWRYDMGAKTGYQFDEAYDFADIEGLKTGNVSMQVFINWSTEQRVESLSAVYLNKADGRVYEYRVFPDGGERVQVITN